VGWIGICSTRVETLARIEPMHCLSVKGDRLGVSEKIEKPKNSRKPEKNN